NPQKGILAHGGFVTIWRPSVITVRRVMERGIRRIAAHLTVGTAVVFVLGPGTARVRAERDSLSTRSATAAELRRQGLQLGYNLDHQEALAVFCKAIAADPDDPAAYRLAAATAWISLLFERGAVTVDDYLGQARANVTRTPPTAALD